MEQLILSCFVGILLEGERERDREKDRESERESQRERETDTERERESQRERQKEQKLGYSESALELEKEYNKRSELVSWYHSQY